MGAAEVVSDGVRSSYCDLGREPDRYSVVEVDSRGDRDRITHARIAPRRAARRSGPSLRGCAGGCSSSSVLELAADAAIVLTATAAVLVFLDWLLRLERAGPARLADARVSRRSSSSWAPGRPGGGGSSRLDDLSLAIVLDRFRPGTGQQVADVLQLPGLLDEPRRRPRRPWCGWRSSRRARPWPRRTGGRSGTAGGRPCTSRPCSLACSIPAAFAPGGPEAARLSVARWLLGSSERWPQRTYLTRDGAGCRGRLLAPRDERFLRWRFAPTCR